MLILDSSRLRTLKTANNWLNIGRLLRFKFSEVLRFVVYRHCIFIQKIPGGLYA